MSIEAAQLRAADLPLKPNLRPTDVARFLDVSRTTVYELISDGGLPSLRIGGQIRIPREPFLRWYMTRPAATEQLALAV